MKRLFFQLILSVMITACHDVKQEQQPKEITLIEQSAEQPANNCSKNAATSKLNHLDQLAQGCPVK
ncbi:hypothetical protein [uncultured Gilliamella sp.]|uniref:hypothetical protein n=1 Tax=uncultured Gilliamella sp. TaxID=1193505 RepID=UPI0025D60E0F|nr:hypothetical protein [uncultured Gilliamella sp.]